MTANYLDYSNLMSNVVSNNTSAYEKSLNAGDNLRAEKIKAVLEPIGSEIIKESLKPALMTLSKTVGEKLGLTGLQSFAKDVGERGFARAIGKRVADTITQKATTALEDATNTVQEGVADATSQVTNAVNTVREGATTAVGDATDAVESGVADATSAVSDATSAVSDATSAVSDAVDNATQGATTAVSDAVDNATQGATTAVGEVSEENLGLTPIVEDGIQSRLASFLATARGGSQEAREALGQSLEDAEASTAERMAGRQAFLDKMSQARQSGEQAKATEGEGDGAEGAEGAEGEGAEGAEGEGAEEAEGAEGEEALEEGGEAVGKDVGEEVGEDVGKTVGKDVLKAGLTEGGEAAGLGIADALGPLALVGGVLSILAGAGVFKKPEHRPEAPKPLNASIQFGA